MNNNNMMIKNKLLSAFLVGSISLVSLGGCWEQAVSQPSNKNTQAQKAKEAANSITFTENAEIENIKKRLELTSNPGLLGYVILLNASGQPILYEGVMGKITSGSKRLTEYDRVVTAGNGSGGTNMAIRQAPSDEGTYGSSNPYIFYTNTDGVYRQWSGDYLYSTQPMRLNITPLVVNIKDKP